MLVMVRKIRGTTSACAENTPKAAVTVLALRNYLRVRGEYRRGRRRLQLPGELPPRARRIPDAVAAAAHIRGTTSACAENTWTVASLLVLPWNYLRVRGEYAIWRLRYFLLRELPPRARRIP
mgnify:CR=1 FL=1